MNIIEEKKAIQGIPVIVCRREDGLPKPLVIVSHGFTGSKEDAKERGYLKELAELGYYAVAMDNRLHGDRPGPNFLTTVIKSFGKVDLFALRKAIKETADDVKLLIDEISAFEEVQEDRIAMIGVSMGGFITFRSIVIDDRIKAGVPIISSPFWDDIPGDIPIMGDEKSRMELQSLSEEYQPSEHLERFYPTALLMQVGDKDKHYNLDRIQRFYADLKNYYRDCQEKLNLIVYSNTEHEFKQEMWEQTLRWLKAHL